MKKIFTLLLAVILILPMGACAEGGGTMANYLTFSSPEPFTISTASSWGTHTDPAWSGTMEYSTDTVNWNEWDSTETVLSSALHGWAHRIYIRGVGNSTIAINYASRWRLNGKNIRCIGNLANIMDYKRVANGENIEPAGNFMDLFNGNSSLVEAPVLPFTKMDSVVYGYDVMFKGCPNLTRAPALPIAGTRGTFYQMFQNDTRLVAIPKLYFEPDCSIYCSQMFSGCTSLKLSETQSEEYPTPYHIPECKATYTNMFEGTGGPFTGTPVAGTTYYLHKSNSIVVPSKLSVGVVRMMNYGGVELPDINEVWDKETYPYAVIAKAPTSLGSNSADTYYLYLSTMPLNVPYTSPTIGLSAAEDGSVITYISSQSLNWHMSASGVKSFSAGETVQLSVNSLKWANFDVPNKNGTVYLAASEPVVIETTAKVFFTCSDLLYTDTVYRIKAWCFPSGTDYGTAPVTWESNLFAGPSHSESVTFTGLLPDVAYEVYAVIYGIEGATEHNATAMFTTAASEEETLEAVVMCNQVTENSFVAWLLALGLDSGKEYTAVFEALENDETSAGSKTVTVSGSSVSQSCAFTGLKPNTDYVVYVDLYTEDRLVFSGEYEVTTLEGEIPGGYDRDSFLLGFASGLGCTAATMDGAEYNSWAQGYIVGAAMRNDL